MKRKALSQYELSSTTCSHLRNKPKKSFTPN